MITDRADRIQKASTSLRDRKRQADKQTEDESESITHKLEEQIMAIGCLMCRPPGKASGSKGLPLSGNGAVEGVTE